MLCHMHRSRDLGWWRPTAGWVEPCWPLAGWPSRASRAQGQRGESMYPVIHKVYTEKDQHMHQTNVRWYKIQIWTKLKFKFWLLFHLVLPFGDSVRFYCVITLLTVEVVILYILLPRLTWTGATSIHSLLASSHPSLGRNYYQGSNLTSAPLWNSFPGDVPHPCLHGAAARTTAVHVWPLVKGSCIRQRLVASPWASSRLTGQTVCSGSHLHQPYALWPP